MTELAAEPRPWHRMPLERAKLTMSCTVRKYGAYLSSAVILSSLSSAWRTFGVSAIRDSAARHPSSASATSASCGVAKPSRFSSGYSVFFSSPSEKLQRSRKRSVRSIASGARRNSRAISCGDFRCRSALASSRRPALSIVTCSRMQVIDVLQRPPLGRVIEHVVHGDQRNECALGDRLAGARAGGCRRRDRACWRRARRAGGTTADFRRASRARQAHRP